ncbi:porin family protein [Jiulongibacter sp. NS-SX5]|uniref:porin family protein n=1 Tax=Jiulongibacter sp. NS-SX5 TaxID=3463854 RepID=UPI00405995CE
MKIASICLLSLLSFAGFSQSGLGIKAGVNMTNISTDAGSLKNNISESLDTKTGYAFGIYGRIGDKFHLQPELLVATKGGKVSVSPMNGGSPELIDVKYTNLDIPVMIGFKPLGFLRVMAGPVASVKLSEDKKLKEALAEYTTNTGEAFANSTWGYQAGIGITVLGFDLDLRREGSLTDINVLNFQNEDKFSQRAAGWQLTLAKKIL